jgi:hypothetical protein
MAIKARSAARIKVLQPGALPVLSVFGFNKVRQQEDSPASDGSILIDRRRFLHHFLVSVPC